MLFDVAAVTGQVRPDVDADDLLIVVANLCVSSHNGGPGHAERMYSCLSMDSATVLAGAVKVPVKHDCRSLYSPNGRFRRAFKRLNF